MDSQRATSLLHDLAKINLMIGERTPFNVRDEKPPEPFELLCDRESDIIQELLDGLLGRKATYTEIQDSTAI